MPRSFIEIGYFFRKFIICNLFESYIGMFDLNQVVRLKGSVEERLKIIDNKLKFNKVKLTKEDILLWNN